MISNFSLSTVTLDSSPENIKTLQNLVEGTFVETFGYLYPKEDLDFYKENTLSLQAVQRQLAEPGVHFYLVTINEGGQEVPEKVSTGYIKFITPGGKYLEQPEKYGKTCYLERLYFPAKFQGKGLAHVAMQFVISAAKFTHGCDFLYLTVWERNHRAQRFYQNFGMRTVHGVKFPVGNTIDNEYLYGLKL